MIYGHARLVIWRGFRYLVPVIIILIALAFQIPVWIRHSQSIQNEYEHLVKLADEQEQNALEKQYYKDLLDSLKLMPFLDANEVSSILLPTVDSLRKLAESMQLRVTSMDQGIRTHEEFQTLYRLDVMGDFKSLLRWLDSIESWNPSIQLTDFRLVPTYQNQMRLVALGVGIMPKAVQKDSVDISVLGELTESLIKDFHRNALRLNQNAASDSVRFANPFEGRWTLKTKPKITVAPVLAPVSAPKIQIVGIVAGKIATVILPSGKKQMIRPGELCEGWIVKEITGSGVRLELNGNVHHYSMR